MEKGKIRAVKEGLVYSSAAAFSVAMMIQDYGQIGENMSNIIRSAYGASTLLSLLALFTVNSRSYKAV